jgi:hypothetical protein
MDRAATVVYLEGLYEMAPRVDVEVENEVKGSYVIRHRYGCPYPL